MSNARDTAHGSMRSPFAGPRPTPAGDRARRGAGTVFDAETPPSNPLDAGRDRDWLAGLMNLLGRLEYGRALLDHPDHARGLASAAKVSAALVEEVAGFAHKRLAQVSDPAAEAAAAAQAFLTAAHVAAAPPKKGLFGLFKAADAPAADAGFLTDLPLVLERYFTLLGAEFREAEAAVQWVNTSGLFLTELRRAVAWAAKPRA